MKKIFSLIMLLLVAGAFALSPPNPVVVHVLADSNANIEVNMRNLDSSDTILRDHGMTAFTDGDGKVLVDWSNYNGHDGDRIVVKVGSIEHQVTLPCPGPGCSELQFNFLDGNVCPPIPAPKNCPSCGSCPACDCNYIPATCPDQEDCDECDKCELCEKCDSCETCPDIDDEGCPVCEDGACPEEDNTFLYGLLGLLGGSAVVYASFTSKFGAALKEFKNMEPGEGVKLVLRKRSDTGKMEVQLTQHKHMYVQGYHSIYTEHRRHKHPKGVVDVDYDADGEYVEGGN